MVCFLNASANQHRFQFRGQCGHVYVRECLLHDAATLHSPLNGAFIERDVAKDEANDTKGEEYQFEIPDFDEEAFIHKEMTSFRTTAVLFA